MNFILFIWKKFYRVATEQGKQGKQGIWYLLFPDRENTGNFVVTQGKFLRHRENILTIYIDAKNMFLFIYFQKNFASLRSAYFLVSEDSCLYHLYQYIYSLTFFITFVTSINQTFSGSLKSKLN